jgi:hypothetical protein
MTRTCGRKIRPSVHALDVEQKAQLMGCVARVTGIANLQLPPFRQWRRRGARDVHRVCGRTIVDNTIPECYNSSRRTRSCTHVPSRLAAS